MIVTEELGEIISQYGYDYFLVPAPDAKCLPGGFNKLVELLEDARKSKESLRIKLGIDPTHKDLHFGHTVCLHYLRKFREYGHTPVLIIGGFTAMVGDPSGRNEARPSLSYEEVKRNAETYLEQIFGSRGILKSEEFQIIDGDYKRLPNGKIDRSKYEKDKWHVVNNYEWLGKIDSTRFIELAHLVTVNQLINKEAFGSRIDKKEPLYLHEVIYPILQGYDSVMVEADVEIGGIDQTFNVLFGRYVQKYFGQKEQFVVLLPLLIGLDGKKKMSKTFNNHIALKDSPEQVFGKTMSIQDELIDPYLRLISNYTLQELSNPLDRKMRLAHNLVSQIWGEEAADDAKSNFVKQFQKKEIPNSVEEFFLSEPLKIVELMYLANLVQSKGEAKRLIAGGGVKLKSVKVDDPNLLITEKDKNSVLQIGKRKFIKIV